MAWKSSHQQVACYCDSLIPEGIKGPWFKFAWQSNHQIIGIQERKYWYHAHPNFHRGLWYDWVMVMYEPFDGEDDTILTTCKLPFGVNENPSKIMCFLFLTTKHISMHLYSFVTIVIMTKTHVSSSICPRIVNTEDPMPNPYYMSL